MDTPTLTNTTNTTNVTNGRNDKKTKILMRGMIVLSVFLMCAAYIFGVQQQRKKNPAFMDPITQFKAVLSAPKINTKGPPGLPGGWVAPMPSTTPPLAPLIP